jgi:hypothetical protein
MRAQAVGLSHRDRGQRRHTVEQFVVVGHLFDALGRHSPAAQDVREKGPDVIGALRATEGDDQNGIEHRSVFVSPSALNRAASRPHLRAVYVLLKPLRPFTIVKRPLGLDRRLDPVAFVAGLFEIGDHVRRRVVLRIAVEERKMPLPDSFDPRQARQARVPVALVRRRRDPGRSSRFPPVLSV